MKQLTFRVLEWCSVCGWRTIYSGLSELDAEMTVTSLEKSVKYQKHGFRYAIECEG